MARPRRSEQTREQLISHGIELLSEHGYHGTGLKQILDAVQVPKGSFYNYFESKEKFVAEIIESYTSGLVEQFDAYLNTTQDDALTKLQAFCQVMILKFHEQGCEKGCLIGNMAAEVGGSSVACQEAMQNTLRRWRKRVVKVVADGQQSGQIRQDVSADDLADVFWSAWEGGILRMKIDGDTQVLEQSLKTLLGVLFSPQ